VYTVRYFRTSVTQNVISSNSAKAICDYLKHLFTKVYNDPAVNDERARLFQNVKIKNKHQQIKHLCFQFCDIAPDGNYEI